jgi:hypothetical protein
MIFDAVAAAHSGRATPSLHEQPQRRSQNHNRQAIHLFLAGYCPNKPGRL